MQRFFSQLFKVIIFSWVGVTTGLVTLFVGIIIMATLVGVLAGETSSSSTVQISDREYFEGDEDSDNELLVLPVTGVIMGEPEPVDDWLTGISSGITYGYEVKNQLQKAAKEDSIKGVLLMVNSPGGTIFGSNAILDGIIEYKKETGKPVIAFVSGMAASGGYWASLGADEIIADSGSTIGSIGVIFGPFKYYDSVVSEDGGILLGGVVTENGISTTYITGGRSKDLGNPYRQLTQEELNTLQTMVNQSYDQFVQKVSENRDINPDVVKNEIGALIYSEQQAQALKLIDASGSKEFAYAVLAQKANLGSDYKLVKLKQEPTFFGALVGAVAIDKTPTVQKSSCALSSVILAYHGDVQVLCE